MGNLLLEDKVSNDIKDIAIIKVDKCKVYENISNIDRLYIIGDSRETVDIKECNVREIIILGEIGVKLGKFDKNSTDIDDININGKIKIEIINGKINRIKSKGSPNIYLGQSVLGDISINGNKVEFETENVEFKTAEIKANKLKISLDTGGNYDGNMLIDAKEIEVDKMISFYNISGIDDNYGNIVEYSGDTAIIHGKIATNKLRKVRKIRLCDESGIIIGSKDKLEIDELVFINSFGAIHACNGAEFYIRNKFKFNNDTEHKLAYALRNLCSYCTIKVDFNSEAHKYLRSREIAFEIIGGIPEDIDRRDRKEGMLGVNQYKKVLDLMNTDDKSLGETIDYDVDKDWGRGYIEDSNSKSKYTGKITIVEKYLLDTIKDIRDIKERLFDGLKILDILQDYDVYSEKEFEAGYLEIMKLNIKFTEDNKISKEEITLFKLGDYLLKAVYTQDVVMLFSKLSYKYIQRNKALGMIDEADTKIRRAFINSVYEDKGYFEDVGREVSLHLAESSEGLKIVDKINNVLVFPSDSTELIAFSAKNKIRYSNSYKIDFEANKFTKTDYTIDMLNKAIDKGYNNSLIRRILEDGYVRDKSHKVTELIELSKKHKGVTEDFIKDIFKTAFFNEINVKKDPRNVVETNIIKAGNIEVVEMRLKKKKEYDKIYLSERKYIHKIGNNYYEGEYSIENVVNILNLIDALPNDELVPIMYSRSKYKNEFIQICVDKSNGKMYLVHKGVKLFKLIDLRRAIQFMVKIRQEEAYTKTFDEELNIDCILNGDIKQLNKSKMSFVGKECITVD